MKKFLIAGVSALTTLAVCTGAVGILATAPSTRNMFDFTGQKEQIISELASEIVNKEQIIKEKDSALLEQDEQIAGLKYANNEKDSIINDKNTIIDDKNTIINEKDAEILGQQATIDELTELLASPTECVIPEELSDLLSLTIVNLTSEYALVSAPNTKVLGMWLLNKQTGIFTKIFDIGGYYSFAYDIGNGRFVTACTFSELEKNYALLVVDTNDLTCSVLLDGKHGYGSYATSPSKKFVIFYSGANLTCCARFDFDTQKLTEIKNIINFTDLRIISDDYAVIRNGSYLLDLNTGVASGITMPDTGIKRFLIFENELYMVSSASGLYKLNISTLSYDFISDKPTSIYYSASINSNVLVISDGNPKGFIYFKDTNEVIALGKAVYYATSLKNGNFLYFETSSLTEFDINNKEAVVSKTFYYNRMRTLSNGDLMSYSNRNVYFYEYKEDTNSYEHISFTLQSNFVDIEDIGEGKYKISCSGGERYIYDSSDSSLILYSLVFE